VRRKVGALLDIDARLLAVLANADSRRGTGDAEMHGFGLAKLVADEDDSRRLTSHGTLYKALSRLEAAGFVASRWEDDEADHAGRPRRRLYRITVDGRAALAEHRSTRVDGAPVGHPGIALS
jgi:DNA-binding PadR family transcriptional regulator